MAKGRYAVVGGTTRKVKKRYAVVGGVTRKIKKRYVVVDGKTRLCWSGFTPKFACAVGGYDLKKDYVLSSENMTSWTKSAQFSDAIMSQGTLYYGDEDRDAVVYGNNMYVVSHGSRTSATAAIELSVSYSEDAVTWTKVVVDSSISVSTYERKLRFCNGLFILYATKNKSYDTTYLYTSSDGKTWTKVGLVTNFASYYSFTDCMRTDIVYTQIDGAYKYVTMLYHGGNSKSYVCYSTDLLTWNTTNYMPNNNNGGNYDALALHEVNGTLYAIIRPNVQYSSQYLIKVLTDTCIGYTGSSYYYFGGSCVDYDSGKIIFFAGDGNTSTDFDYYVSNLSSLTCVKSGTLSGYSDWSCPSCGNGKIVQLVNNTSQGNLSVRYGTVGGDWTYIIISEYIGKLSIKRMVFARE